MMLRATFAMPAVLAVASLLGLVFALTGDGARDLVACFALALPLAAVAWAMRVRRG